MQPISKNFLNQALELPEPDRVEVATLLLDSIHQANALPLFPEWIEEIDARVDELARGNADCIPLDEAMRRLRERLK